MSSLLNRARGAGCAGLLFITYLAGCASGPQNIKYNDNFIQTRPPHGLIRMCETFPEVCYTEEGKRPVFLKTPRARLYNIANDEIFYAGHTGGSDAASTPETPQNALATSPAKTQIGRHNTSYTAKTIANTSFDNPRKLMRTAHSVNRRVNAKMLERTDIDTYGMSEMWTLPLTLETGHHGDCEDFALEKRQALINAGVPGNKFFLAIVHSKQTGRHVVLVVDVDGHEYVLDNVYNGLRRRQDTPYRWIKRQADGADLTQWLAYQNS